MSLDFTFTHHEFVRLFSITSDPFAILLKLKTNAPGMVDFLSGTGFLVDQNGNPLEAPMDLGSASRNDGSLAAGLYPLLPGDLQRPLDFFGIHFDLTLPFAPSVSITSEQFRLRSDVDGPFGVGPGVPRDIFVPDTADPIYLFGIGLAGLLAVRFKFA